MFGRHTAPRHPHNPIAVGLVEDVVAIGTMHRHTPTAGHIAGDWFTHHWITTAGEAGQQAIHATHTNIGVGLFADFARRGRGGWIGDDIFGHLARQHFLANSAGRQFAATNQHQHFVDWFDVHQAGEVFEGYHQAEPFELFFEHFTSGRNVFITISPLKKTADVIAGAHCFDEVQPIAARAIGGALGHNLDHFAGLELIIERHHALMHPGTDAVIADVGVDAISKVDGSRTHRQVDDFATRGKDKNLFFEEVRLEALDEVGGHFATIGHFVAPRHQTAQPDDFVVEFLVGAFVAIFVAPMGGDTMLGHFMHFGRANLDFTRLSAGNQHGGVQRAVKAFFGVGDIIVEFAGHGWPRGMYQPQYLVAFGDGSDNHPHGELVVDLFEAHPFAGHFTINRVDVFGAPRDFAIDLLVPQHVTQALNHPLHSAFTHIAAHRQLAADFLVMIGFKHCKRTIFEFPFELANPEAMGQGHVDFDGFAGDAALFFRFGDMNGAHVV